MRNNNSSNEIIFVSAVRKQNVLLIFTHFLIYICKMLQTPPQKKDIACLCRYVTLSWCGLFQGFTRVYDNMPDICLDVPNAYQLLEIFINLCHKEGFLSEAFVKDLPQR